jgi:hypothetical protein
MSSSAVKRKMAGTPHAALSMSRKLKELEAKGHPIDADVLKVLAPYRREHINRFGDYRLDLQKKVASGNALTPKSQSDSASLSPIDRGHEAVWSLVSRRIRRLGRKAEAERHATDLIAHDPDTAGVCFDDRPTDRQPHAHARFLCGGKWLEYRLQIRDPHAFILNVDHHVVSIAPGADR